MSGLQPSNIAVIGRKMRCVNQIARSRVSSRRERHNGSPGREAWESVKIKEEEPRRGGTNQRHVWDRILSPVCAASWTAHPHRSACDVRFLVQEYLFTT